MALSTFGRDFLLVLLLEKESNMDDDVLAGPAGTESVAEGVAFGFGTVRAFGCLRS